MDSNEKINKYLSSVHLKPFAVNLTDIYKDFNPADPNLNSPAVVKFMKKVALQSSQNLKRNADAFCQVFCTTMTNCFGLEAKEHRTTNLL